MRVPIRALPGLIDSWRTEAPLTLAIVAINLIIHLGVSLGGDLANDALWDIAANSSDSPFSVWRWFTSAWIHTDFRHVLGNCLFLLLAGRLLEPTIGSGRFALVYAISILGCSIVSIPTIVDEDVQIGGASGAVYGVIGALLVLPTCRKLWRAIFVWVAVAYQVGADMSYGPVPGIHFAGHVGGLIAGLIAGCFAGSGAQAPEPPDKSPSTLPLPLPVRLGTVGLFSRRPNRQEESAGFRVARGLQGKSTRPSLRVPDATDDADDAEVAPSAGPDGLSDQGQPPRIAVVSVWPDRNGLECR